MQAHHSKAARPFCYRAHHAASTAEEAVTIAWPACLPACLPAGLRSFAMLRGLNCQVFF